jgi:hypothetical protein
MAISGEANRVFYPDLHPGMMPELQVGRATLNPGAGR